jgi:hypothetical protein
MLRKKIENITVRPGKKYAGLAKVVQRAADKDEDALNKYLLKLLSKIHGYVPNTTKRK